MAYTDKNFKTKKALKEAVAKGEQIGVYNPGLGQAPPNGSVTLEGPHYPKPHSWYASAIVKDGVIVPRFDQVRGVVLPVSVAGKGLFGPLTGFFLSN